MFLPSRHRDYELPPQRRVPLGMQMPLGIVFGVLAFLIAVCAIGILTLTFTAKRGADNPGGDGIIVSAVLSLMCFYLARISLRLIRKQENQVGESSPRAIRLVSYYFLFLFLAGLFDLACGKMALRDSPGLAVDLIGFLILQRMARLRERQEHNQLPDPTSSSVTPPAGAGDAPSVAADH
jgi:hypothetical protein